MGRERDVVRDTAMSDMHHEEFIGSRLALVPAQSGDSRAQA